MRALLGLLLLTLSLVIAPAAFSATADNANNSVILSGEDVSAADLSDFFDIDDSASPSNTYLTEKHLKGLAPLIARSVAVTPEAPSQQHIRAPPHSIR